MNAPVSFSINDMCLLSRCLNTLQHRLIATIQILKYIQDVEKIEDLYQWELDITTWKVSRVKTEINVSYEMAQTVRLFGQDESLYSDASDVQPFILDEKRQLMAVIAYMICFGSNPYLGKLYYEKVVITHEWTKNYFGKERIFSFDQINESNYPDLYYQLSTLELWEKPNNADIRMILDSYFAKNHKEAADDILEKAYGLLAKLNTSVNRGIKVLLIDNDLNTSYLLTDGKSLFDTSFNLIGSANQRTENGRIDLYLTNESDACWEVRTVSGNEILIQSGEKMPLRDGMFIIVHDGTRDKIVWKIKKFN